MARLRSAPARQRRLADAALSAEVAAPAGDRRLASLGAVAGTLVVADQLTKQWALSALADGPIDLVGSLRLRLSFNSGTAFSLGSGRGGLISVLGLVVVAVLLRGVLAWPGRLPLLAAGLVAGGAVGNVVDRIFRDGEGFLGGKVVDFVDLQWWPVFNVADMGICVGAALLAILSFRQPEP
jgi:signal peptidase II